MDRAILLMLLLSVLVHFSACKTGEDLTMSDKVRVLLDTDANNELDDQHAIAYLLLNGDRFVVEGLTVNRTNNGGDIEEQALEAERIVRLCALHPELPVTRGASGSFEEIVPHLDNADFDGAAAVELIIERAHADADQKLVLLPVGKLTNIALALKKDPAISSKVKVVWLGSNYPDPGEYNQDNDEAALNYILDSDVEFEIALVRYGTPYGTDAVRVTPQDVLQNLAGKGPRAATPVTGRHGGTFFNFGDYSVDLFEHIKLHGDPPSRALFDMAAVAIVKNPAWAEARTIPAPLLQNSEWQDRPENAREIILWETFDKQAIIDDFYKTMDDYQLVKVVK
jgi:inosine-uridine nucleoside N-ribohydrolase